MKMNKRLVEWVRKEKSGWTVILVIRRNMLVFHRGKEEEEWEGLLSCLQEQKVALKKVLGRYLKGTGIEKVIRVLKQGMGIGERLVRKGKGWSVGWFWALCCG